MEGESAGGQRKNQRRLVVNTFPFNLSCPLKCPSKREKNDGIWGNTIQNLNICFYHNYFYIKSFYIRDFMQISGCFQVDFLGLRGQNLNEVLNSIIVR